MTPQNLGFRLREVREGDAIKLCRLARNEMYYSANISQDPMTVTLEVRKSVEDFGNVRRNGETLELPLFKFVLEAINTGEIVGTSLVRAISERLYYEVEGGGTNGKGTLKLSKEPPGTFELGGLLLAKEMRGLDLAKLLSLGRALILADISRVLPVKALLTEFLLYADGRESYSDSDSDPFFWKSVALPSLPGMTYRMAERFWKRPGMYGVFARRLPPSIEFDPAYGDMIAEPNIHPASRPARKLLTSLGLANECKVGADGSIYYRADWHRTEKILSDARLERQNGLLKIDNRRFDGKLPTVIATWASNFGCEARYAPLAQGEDGVAIFVDRERCGIPSHAELYAF